MDTTAPPLARPAEAHTDSHQLPPAAQRRLDEVAASIKPLRDRLASHRVYDLLRGVDDIRIFSESHVYAVWDFMSLLKALQQHLTCVTVPWRPSADPKVARFVNELVLDEETDLAEDGKPASHFVLYLAAMGDLGADTQPVLSLVGQTTDLASVAVVAERLGVGAGVQQFLGATFGAIGSGQAHRIASAFTFGREDLLPDVFLNVLARAERQEGERYPKFEYYLRRHIELDGDEHGPIALKMVAQLCGEDDQRWAEVTETARKALAARLALWDEIEDRLSR